MKSFMLKLFCFMLIVSTALFIGTACKDNGGNEDNTQHVCEFEKTVIAPTCTMQGYTLNECSCGEKYKDSYVNALGHVSTPAVKENEVLATCSSGGSYDSVVYCNTCGAEFSRTKINTSKLGHDFKFYIANGDATCEVDGTKTAKCENCEETDTITDVGSKLKFSEGLEYTLNEDGLGYTVIGIGDCVDTNIVIPSTYDGKPVTSIGDRAFFICRNLTSIEIPNSVTSIGNYAFYYCNSLTSIEIPNSVTSIGNYAFRDCYSLTCIEIPNSVTSIGDYAFGYCTNLTSIEIPSSVTNIGSSVFYCCFKLVEVINRSPYIIVEKGSEENGYLGYYALNVVNGDNSYVSILNTNENGFITYNDGNDIVLLAYAGKETELEIPNSITSIGDYAFALCYRLTSIEIPNSVTNIGDSAFYWCDSLTNVTIGNSVTSIGYEAFHNCDSLTTVTIGNSVTSIGSRAFYDCNSLTNVTIGNSVTSIGDWAFGNCNSLTIYCEATTKPNGWSSDWNIDLNRSNCPVVWNCNNNNVATDGYIYALIDGLRYGIKNGEATVVEQPKNITTANIPSSITFNGTIYNVTSIGDFAFYDCYNLTSIEIPNRVKSISDFAFYDCGSLTSITVDSSNTAYKSIDGVLYSKDGTELICYPAGKTAITFTIPNSVTSIGNYAFYSCDNLNTITYNGTKSEWNSISKGSVWAYMVKATYVTCTDGNVKI